MLRRVNHKVTKSILSFLIMMLLAFPCFAHADVDLSSMDLNELSQLRDLINQEINARGADPSANAIVTDTYKLSFDEFRETHTNDINELYDKYNPAFGTNDDVTSFSILFTFENKTDQTVTIYRKLTESSINGWMVNGYLGMPDVAGKKKAKGFLYVILQDCEAETGDEVNSMEFVISVQDENRKVLDERTVSFVKTDSGFVMQ